VTSLRAPWADIDVEALRHNLGRARAAAGGAKVFAVVKADAYGHGMLACARAMQAGADGFVVSTLGEAEALRKGGITQRVMVLQGFSTLPEARLAARLMLEPVIHQPWQVDVLEGGHTGLPLKVWLKIDTGMHRMGIEPGQVRALHARLMATGRLREAPGLMTHFARADEADPAATRRQIEVFGRAVEGLPGERSLSNSAGLFGGHDAQGDIVRPGIALYGGNPFTLGSAAGLDLRPVMALKTRLLAVQHFARGEPVGYGASYLCPEDMPVGVAAVGYGDGYPRAASLGAPAWINGQRVTVVGRVSMDLLMLDLRGVTARHGDEVTLWGGALPVDEVARHAGTIGYELLCSAGGRVMRHYHPARA